MLAHRKAIKRKCIYNQLASFISRRTSAAGTIGCCHPGTASARVTAVNRLNAFASPSFWCSGEFPCMLYSRIKVDEILEVI
jgi:hypothetical protein